jgi:hypothetical protein
MPKNLKNLIDTELEIAFFGIIAIMLLEFIALMRKIDGTMFGMAMTAIGGIIGWVFKGYHSKKR